VTDYCTLVQVKTALRIPVEDTRDDERIELAISAATQAIEDYCDRSLIAAGTATAVRTFVPDSDRICTIDDLGSVTSLVIKTDGSGDATWDTTWTSTDYQLEPVANRRGQQSLPYTRIRAIGDFLFPLLPSRQYPGQATVQVTGRWGWPTQPDVVTKAAVLQSVRFFKRDEAPFGVTGFGDVGVMRITRSLDPDVQAHLDPFRRVEGYA
jgi:hypothetical protein